MNIGMKTRVRYEVPLFKMRNGYEDLYDWIDAEGYRDAVMKAKKHSLKEGIIHAEVVKNIDFFYPDRPEQVMDTHVEKRWFYEKGKLTGKADF